MRLVKMGPRSRYWGLDCVTCGKPIAEGRIALVSSYWTYEYRGQKHRSSFGAYDEEEPLRVAHHRTCVEQIFDRGPVDVHVGKTLFEEYRDKLLDRLDDSDDDESDEV